MAVGAADPAGGPAGESRALNQDDLTRALGWFWHPVATVAEAEAAGGVVAARLLGRDLAVARLEPGKVAVLDDRCPHRSTRLSVGCVDRGAIRCAYHGWRWDPSGACVEIPSAPAAPIPSRFRQGAYEGAERHGLLWARLHANPVTSIPALPAADQAGMRIVAGAPYTWPTSAPRRVENFVDFAHFAWVHDGTLGNRDHPVPPDAEVRRQRGELRFSFEPAPLPGDEAEATALFGFSAYRMPIPLTVNIEFDIDGRPGVRRHLWMTASPVDPGVCRSFWFVARNDEHDRPDEEFLEFQHVVLAEDEPVVCNQTPAEIPLDPTEELHVRADRISVEYRRFLRDVVVATAEGPDALAACLGTDDDQVAPVASSTAAGAR